MGSPTPFGPIHTDSEEQPIPMNIPRGRAWAPIALVVTLVSLAIPAAAAAAPGDLPDIVQDRPGYVTGGYFDENGAVPW